MIAVETSYKLRYAYQKVLAEYCCYFFYCKFYATDYTNYFVIFDEQKDIHYSKHICNGFWTDNNTFKSYTFEEIFSRVSSNVKKEILYNIHFFEAKGIEYIISNSERIVKLE